MTKNYDLIVIGAGPGGYVAAIKAAQLGLKVACVEKRKTLGGTCLNVGCIPSKALLEASHLYHQLAGLEKYGIKTGKVDIDITAMMANKDKIVEDLTKGIDGLFKKNKVALITGEASFINKDAILVEKEEFTAKNFIIATGSSVTPLKGVEIDEKQILSSTGALELNKIPKSMIVIGAGVIGLEMGSIWARLGTEVTVVEYQNRIVPAMDGEMARALQRSLEKQGLAFRLATKVLSAKVAKTSIDLQISPANKNEIEKLTAETVLLAIGRRPNTDGLALDKIGIALDKHGFIPVDSHLQTIVPNIYAIGDVVPGPMLAHKAEDEGLAAAEIIAGKAGHVNYDAIPSVIYTHPEFASVGKNEEELKAAGISYKIGKFSMMANSRARAISETEGSVKILTCATTDRILGAHIFGKDAGNLIHEIVVAMEFGGSAEDLARTCHAHPTLAEAIKEAAMAAYDKPIHS